MQSAKVKYSIKYKRAKGNILVTGRICQDEVHFTVEDNGVGMEEEELHKLQVAKEAGVPVIVMDRSVNVADQSLYTTHVGSDSMEEGRKAGRWLEKELAK